MKTPIVRWLVVCLTIFSIAVSTAYAKGGVKFMISVSAGPNGKIKPAKTVNAKQGSSKTFTATPAKGFKAAILLDGSFVVVGTAQAAVRFTLSGITAPHTIEARFVTLNGSFTPATNVNISIVGFGNSPTVSNHTPVTIGGLAGADAGLQAVQALNVSTGASASVIGTSNWSASVPLKVGDNLLRFTGVANDNSKAQIETTITYSPDLDFTSALEASRTVLFNNSNDSVNFTIGIQNTSGAVVTLFRTDVNGTLLDAGTQMFDNGTLPDEIQSDGIFTAGVFPDTSTTGFRYYRARVMRNNSTFFSEVARVWVTGHLSNGEIDLSVNLANGAQQTFTNAVNQGQSESQAAMTTLTSLQSNPGVGAAGMTPEHGVWWVSQDGILGLFHVFQANEKGGLQLGTRTGTSATQIKTAAGTVSATKQAPHQIRYYKNSAENGSLGTSGLISKTAAVSGENRIRSRKGIIISPFINNLVATANGWSNFGKFDDYSGPWQIIKAAGVNSCKLYDAAEFVNNGGINVSHQTFENLSDFGYIHESSHGDNYYNGLFSLWKDVWGSNDFLKGFSSQPVIFTGEFLVKDISTGNWNISGFEEDLKAHRMAIGPNGAIALLPEFFKTYLSDLPNSLVILSSCRSTRNGALASVFLSYGAGAVVGFTDYVNSDYSQNTLNTLVQDLYMDKTVLEGAVDAVAKFGQSDGPPDPAFFTLYGAPDLKLAGPELQNGGFEEGTLSSWNPDGDGRVIRQLGSTFPTEGSFMGIISTGLGFTTTSGSIRQDFCLPANATTLNFDWNFFSEEFLEFCGSQFQDFFNVTLYELDSNGIPVNSHLLFHRQIDDLCGSVMQADVGFDQGDVYDTGWLNQALDVSAYQGEHVIIEFSAGDVGDSIYDTAILLDHITVNTAP